MAFKRSAGWMGGGAWAAGLGLGKLRMSGWRGEVGRHLHRALHCAGPLSDLGAAAILVGRAKTQMI